MALDTSVRWRLLRSNSPTKTLGYWYTDKLARKKNTKWGQEDFVQLTLLVTETLPTFEARQISAATWGELFMRSLLALWFGCGRRGLAVTGNDMWLGWKARSRFPEQTRSCYCFMAQAAQHTKTEGPILSPHPNPSLQSSLRFGYSWQRADISFIRISPRLNQIVQNLTNTRKLGSLSPDVHAFSQSYGTLAPAQCV